MKGFVMVPDEWITPDIEPGAFQLLCLLAKYARADGTCHLGTAELAAFLKLTEREIRYRLRELEAAGLVRREYQDQSRRHMTGIVVPGAKVVGRGHAATPTDGTSIPSVDGTSIPSRRNKRSVHRRNKRSVKTPTDGTPVPSVDGTNMPSPLKREERPKEERPNSTPSEGGVGGRDEPDLRLVRPSREPERPRDVPARAKQVRELAASLWTDGVGAELEYYAATNTNVDWEALEYAITAAAADRDRVGKTIDRPARFILNEYRKHYLQELPAGPVAPRPSASAPARVDRAQAKVDEFRRYMAAKAAKAAASKEASS